METIVVSFLITALFAILLLIGVKFHRRLIRKYVEEIGTLLQSPKIQANLSGYDVTGVYREREVTIAIRMGGGQRSIYYTVTISLAADTPFELAVYRQGLLYRLGRALGLIRNVASGDSDFESRFMIRAPHEVIAREFFTEPSHRQIFEEILQKGYRSLTARKGTILVAMTVSSRRALKSALDPKIVGSLLDGMVFLSDALKAGGPH